MMAQPRTFALSALLLLLALTEVRASEPVPTQQQWDSLLLRRAVYEWASADPLRALSHVDSIAQPEPRALLLQSGWHRAEGDFEGFADLLVRALELRPALRNPLLARGLYDALEGHAATALPNDAPPALQLLAAAVALDRSDLVAADALLDGDSERAHPVLAKWLRAELALRSGERIESSLEALIATDTAWLSDAARLQRAQFALDQGEDPSTWLHAIDEPAFQSRAQHLLALQLLAQDPAAGTAALHELFAADPEYHGRQDVALQLAAAALESGDAAAALQWYEAAAAQWQLREEALRHTDSISRYATPRLGLESASADATLATLLHDAGRLRQELSDKSPELELPPLRLPDETLLRLSAEHADSLANLEEAAQIALWRARVAEQRAREADEALQRQRRFLEHGSDEALGLGAQLTTAQEQLAQISSRLDTIRQKLDAVHDLELQRIALRTERLIELAARNGRAIGMLRDVYVEGPMARYDQRLEPETPQPRDLLAREVALSTDISDFSKLFAQEVPELLARSMRERLAPRILETAPLLEMVAAQLAADQANFLANAKLAHDAALSSAALERWTAEATRLVAEEQDLRQRHTELTQQAREAARAVALAELSRQREGIDYGLAAAIYERSLQLAEAGDESSDEAVQLRRRGIAALELGLSTYPQAAWRSEARFRLADLLLADARGDFHERMQRYLATQQGPVPVLDHERELELYRSILAEDPTWPHADSARYSLGMILADQEDPQARAELEVLVREHPDSQHRQRAELRLADLYFAQENFAVASQHFAVACQGQDPEIVAIASYKLGWCHLNQERYQDAALAFTQLLDLYEAGFTTAQAVDLRKEGEDDLVQTLAHAGGAKAFAAHFELVGEKPYAPAILAALSNMLRHYALYDEAIASDELYLARYPLRAQALDAGERLLDSHRHHSKAEQLPAAQLALAERFRPDGAWASAQSDSAALNRANDFARRGYRESALKAHRAAKDGQGSEYRTARAHYETLLALWPQHGEAPRFSLLAGQCALEQKDYASALDHFAAAAASDTASFRVDAAWQRVYTADRWYESSRPDENSLGDEKLASQLLTIGGEFLQAQAAEPRSLDLRWRLANLEFAHGHYEAATVALLDFSVAHPADARAWQAHRLRAEAFQKLSRFDQAAFAYQAAVDKAPATEPSRAEMARLIPHCHFKHAEAIADAGEGAQAAPLFAAVADRFADFEHAPLARYRGGLLFAEANDGRRAIEQWEALIAQHPQHELATDSHRRIAAQWQADERWAEASRAYERYSEAHPTEADAADALLLAVDMAHKAGDSAAERRLQDRYLARFPNDLDMAFLVREARADAALASIGSASISTLLGSTQAPSELQHYLKLAEQHPEQASPAILARVRFLKAEELRTAFEKIALAQPLEKSLLKKKDSLEALLRAYASAAELATSPWAQASAYRIGEALAHFGDNLAAAPAPSELQGDDEIAYREVLEQQSWPFFDRAESAWTQLLRDGDESANDSGEWFEKTRQALYPRIAKRFAHRIEVEIPLIEAIRPAGVSGAGR